MNFNKLEIIDFGSGNITDFISRNLLADETEEVCYIYGEKKLADFGSLSLINDNIMSFKLNDMDEDDVDDCTNCLIIMDGITFDNHQLKQLINNSVGTYVLRDFTNNQLKKKEVSSLLNQLEVQVQEDINDILLESIKLVVDSEYYLGINDKIYYADIKENKEVETEVQEVDDEFEEELWINDENLQKTTIKEPYYTQSQQQYTEPMWFKEVIGNKVVELRSYETAIKNTYVDRTGQLYQRKNKDVALLLAVFLGFYGGDKFYLKRYKMGVVYIFTGGLFVFGWMYSIFKLVNSERVYAKLSKISFDYHEKAKYEHEKTRVETSTYKEVEESVDNENFCTEIPYVTVTTEEGLIKVVNIVEAHKGITKGIYTGGYELKTIPITSRSNLKQTESLLNFGDENVQIYKGLDNCEINLLDEGTITFCALGKRENRTIISLLVELLNVESYYLPEEHIKLYADDIEVKYIGGAMDLIKNNFSLQILEFSELDLTKVKNLRIVIKAGYTSKNFEDKFFEQEFNINNN